MGLGQQAMTLDWYDCATFRLRTAGLPGHSHFDHLDGAETIVASCSRSGTSMRPRSSHPAHPLEEPSHVDD